MKTLEAMMWSMRAGGVALLCALIGLCATAGSAAMVTATAEPFRLSIQHDGIRPSAGDETLTYSDLWDNGEDATVTLAQEGVPLAEGLTGEGERAWNVIRNGTYTLTHTTYTNGVAGKVETATFIVAGLDVPFASGDVTLTGYTGVYDGQPHGIGVTVAEGIVGAAKKYATNPSAVFTKEPPALMDVGSLTVWCEISAPGYITQTNSATVTVTPRQVTFTSKSTTKVYDGTPLTAHEVAVGGDGFAGDEGAVYTFTGSQTAVGTSENTFTYTLNENTKADNYEISTANGTLTVTKATIGGEGGGDEPGSGNVPDGGLSKFDAAFVYDGTGHTIDTNALVTAFGTAMIGESAVEYAAGGSQFTATVSDAMNCVPPCFTNAGEYVVWYRVTNPNYEDFVRAAKVTISKRPVTLTSGTKLDFVYDGRPHACPHFIKSGQDFVEGEGIIASNWATVTTVAECEVANTFDYVAQEGTDLANYTITVVTGRIAVVAAPIPVGSDGVVTTAGYTNIYDGAAHGVAVSANVLLTVPTVQYRAGEAEDWADVSPTFNNVCDTQVWYRVSAPNYAPIVGSVGVRITPRPVTFTSKSATKVYDGTPLTAHEVAVGGDGFADGEGATYAFTGSQTAVGTSENTFTYTLDGNTKAGNYEITTVNGSLTVTKVSIGGDEPGDGGVPDGGLSKFDTTFVYDDEGHTIDTNALVEAFGTAMIGESTLEYAAGGSQFTATVSDAMKCIPPCFTNAGEYVVWYQVTNPNYEDFIHQARVTITPRDISKATIAPIPDVTFANRPATPVPTVTDQTPSIIKASDYVVSYRDNDRPGTATVTLTGTGNYRGTKSATFLIKPAPVLYAALRGTLAWKLNTGTGCYTAQLKLTCTNGFDQGISDLRFVYQDRRDGAKITSGLWDSSARAYRPTTFLDGTAYRFVELDAARITGQDVTALYGVQDVTQAVGMVPAAECAIELFVGNLSSPISDIGYVMWKSNGTYCALPVSAAGGSQGMAVSAAMPKAVRMAASVPLPGVPLSLSALNTSLALGVVVDPASSPYCRLTDFAVAATDLTGRIEVGKERGGTESKGSLGTNARVILLGAKTLVDGFTEFGRVSVDDGGAFRFALGGKGCHFFRVRIEIENVVE